MYNSTARRTKTARIDYAHGIYITTYGTRAWAVYDNNDMICCAVYRKGAVKTAETIAALKSAQAAGGGEERAQIMKYHQGREPN
jgi:hypothetical protein